MGKVFKCHNLSILNQSVLINKCKISSNSKTQLTLQDKQKIIGIIEAREKVGAKPNFTQIGMEFKTHRTTIGKIAKDRDIIKSRATLETQSPKSKKFRPYKHENVDEALHMWHKQKTERQDARLHLPLLKEKASELAQKFGEEFEPSDSWLNRFKSRHSMKFKKEQGEKH